MISENQEKLMMHVCNIPYSLSCSIFPVKISVFPSLFKAIDQFKPKFANTFIEVI